MTKKGLVSVGELGPKRTGLPEEVARYVREQIVTGAVRPGEFLRIEPIAEAVGVSNTPVREGLLMLKSEGFLQLAPRRGFIVAPLRPQDVRDLLWAQGQLGGELVARATQNMTPHRLRILETNLQSYDQATSRSDWDATVEIAHQFHREINLAADSPRLALLQGAVVQRLPIRFYAPTANQIADAGTEHAAIVEALRRRNPRKARSVMEAHFREGSNRLIETFEKRGMWNVAEDKSAS